MGVQAHCEKRMTRAELDAKRAVAAAGGVAAQRTALEAALVWWDHPPCFSVDPLEGGVRWKGRLDYDEEGSSRGYVWRGKLYSCAIQCGEICTLIYEQFHTTVTLTPPH